MIITGVVSARSRELFRQEPGTLPPGAGPFPPGAGNPSARSRAHFRQEPGDFRQEPGTLPGGFGIPPQDLATVRSREPFRAGSGSLRKISLQLKMESFAGEPLRLWRPFGYSSTGLCLGF